MITDNNIQAHTDAMYPNIDDRTLNILINNDGTNTFVQYDSSEILPMKRDTYRSQRILLTSKELIINSGNVINQNKEKHKPKEWFTTYSTI